MTNSDNNRKPGADDSKAIPATGAVQNQNPGQAPAKSIYGEKRKMEKFRRRRDQQPGGDNRDELEQRIVDIARVTRVMAGGKRMRFRACVAIGNKNGKIAVGLAKGADVTIAVTKAVNSAKKNIIDVPIVKDTIPHNIYQKLGAAKILLKPARRGRGVIAGGAARIIIELSGIKNITSKNLGTSNKVNVAKCTIEALKNLKKVDVKQPDKTEKEKQPEPVAEIKK
jgi:small subunit ribosomal protein S5